MEVLQNYGFVLFFPLSFHLLCGSSDWTIMGFHVPSTCILLLITYFEKLIFTNINTVQIKKKN